MTYEPLRFDPTLNTTVPQSEDRGGTPGKKAPTDALPARHPPAPHPTMPHPAAGLPLVAQGPLCEQPMAAGNTSCVLTHDERVWLLHTLSVNVQVAMANFRDAIQDARIDKLTASGAGWGFLEEFLFMTATGPLVGAAVGGARVILGRAAARLAETSYDALTLRIAKIDEGAIRSAVTNVSKGARSHIKHIRMSMAEGNFGKAAFLAAVRESIGPTTRALLTVLPTTLDDESLIALTLAYGDESLHGMAAYRSYLDEMLASLDENHIDDVGRTRTHTQHIGGDAEVEQIDRGRLVWVTQHDGERKLAIVAGQTSVVRWVDPRWIDLAQGLYRERSGRAPDQMTMDGFNTSDTPGAEQQHADRQWLEGFFKGHPQ